MNILNKNTIFNHLNDLSVSHGINLQVLSYLTALGGYIKFPKNHIILLLIILFLATSWPDIITFYRDELFTEDNKMFGKFEAFKVLITELIVITILISPLIFIYSKKIALIVSYTIAIILLYINNHINMKYIMEKNIQTIILYLFVSYIIYLISDFLLKIIKR
jgi:hypothetical protein